MRVTRLWLTDFRNYESAELEPDPSGLTVIVGSNGEGKTNLLEAVYYLQLLRSARGARDQDLVRFGAALNAGRLLKPETLAAMYTPQTDALREFRDGKPTDRKAEGQGLLWGIRRDPAGRRFVYHCGSVQEFQACLVSYPEKDLVVAILANSSDSTGWKENLAVADFFLEPAPAP